MDEGFAEDACGAQFVADGEEAGGGVTDLLVERGPLEEGGADGVGDGGEALVLVGEVDEGGERVMVGYFQGEAVECAEELGVEAVELGGGMCG